MNAPSPPAQVFVVGMNGSGTTMLRDHLANHSWIYGFPAETRSLPYFIERQQEYGNLNDEHNFGRLWKDLKKSVSKRADLLPETLPLPDVSDRSPAGTFDHIMRHLARAHGKRIWCEKTPMYVHHLTLLGKAFPHARFIHIIRDGRSCAASFHRRWKFNPVRTVARWKQAVREGRRQGHLLGDRYLEIRYEALTEQPEAAFVELLEFLDLPFENAVLTSSRSNADPATSHSPNVVQNSAKAGDYFDRDTLESLESVAGRLLTELGYECSNKTGDRDPPGWQLEWWRKTDDIRRFVNMALAHGRILQPSRWRYIAVRTRNALKQRATSKW